MTLRVAAPGRLLALPGQDGQLELQIIDGDPGSRLVWQRSTDLRQWVDEEEVLLPGSGTTNRVLPRLDQSRPEVYYRLKSDR
ncbi:MAG: hypothetical protein ACYDC1_03305 [Limisphaerales bacterium]